MEISNVNENYTQNFILDRLTVPLARKLAVAAFIDLRPEAAQMQDFKTHDTIYNAGSIISEVCMQSPAISQSVRSIAPEISDSFESPDTGFQPWRSFTSMLSAAWKKLLPGRKQDRNYQFQK